jgi:hypothetical protein
MRLLYGAFWADVLFHENAASLLIRGTEFRAQLGRKCRRERLDEAKDGRQVFVSHLGRAIWLRIA